MTGDKALVAGMYVTRAGLDEAALLVCQEATSGGAKVFTLINAHSAKLRRESLEYEMLLMDSRRTVGLADGASVTAAARLLGQGNIGRCPGPDLMELCSRECAEQGIPIFLLGGAAGVAERLACELSRRHPTLLVAGAATPPYGIWPREEDTRLIALVKESGARILWMGVSAPKQEIWAYRHLEQLEIPIVCVGAAFDFNTGSKGRAPMWMRKAGLEWVHRLVTEPRRMWKRYLVGNSLFLWDVVRYGKRPASVRADGRA